MNNSRNVTVKLTGVHARDGEKSEKTISTHHGIWKSRENIHEIAYLESLDEVNPSETENTDSDDNPSLIRICSDSIELTRNGSYSSNMIFDIKKEHCTRYSTPFGYMDINIKTTSLDMDITENGITANIEYVMNSDGRELSQSFVRIEINAAE